MKDAARTAFIEIVQKRMNKAIKAIRLIGKLDIRGGYHENDLNVLLARVRAGSQRSNRTRLAAS